MGEVKLSKQDRFRHRLVTGDLSKPNGVVLNNYKSTFDQPISPIVLTLRKFFKNLYQ